MGEVVSVAKSYKRLIELMVREQFTNSCSKDATVHLTECGPKKFEELVMVAEQYLVARNKKLLCRGTSAKPKGTLVASIHAWRNSEKQYDATIAMVQIIERQSANTNILGHIKKIIAKGGTSTISGVEQ